MKEEHIVTYRYVLRTKDMVPDRVGVKYISETAAGHDDFIKRILADENVISCLREYVSEYDCALIGKYESVKDEGGIIDEKV